MTKSNADGNILAKRRHQSEVTLQYDKHSAEVQTDLTMDELASLESNYQLRLKEIYTTAQSRNKPKVLSNRRKIRERH